MRNECRVCLTDGTLKFLLTHHGHGIIFNMPLYAVLECASCKAVGVWREATKELRWYAFRGVVSRVETLTLESQEDDSDRL